jgi:hypothetical protein
MGPFEASGGPIFLTSSKSWVNLGFGVQPARCTRRLPSSMKKQVERMGAALDVSTQEFGLPLPPFPLGTVRLLRQARDHERRCRRFRIRAWIESGRRGVEPACADAL